MDEGYSDFMVTPLDILILAGVLIIVFLIGVAFYRLFLGTWVNSGKYPQKLRWASFWLGLSLAMISTLLPFWPMFESLRGLIWWLAWVIYGLTLLFITMTLWLVCRRA